MVVALRNVAVELRVGDQLFTKTTTDRDGKFYFPGIRPGTYRIIATRDGYIHTEYGQRQTGGSGLPILLSPGQKMSGIHIDMLPGGVISGHGITDRGKPISFASVTALESFL